MIHFLAWELVHSVVNVALGPEGRFVGMAVYRPCIDGSGWLAMARTHPRFRRQGVNRAIMDSFLAHARRSGAAYLRLWTNAGNVEGVATFSALGFREVARFTRFQAAPSRGPPRFRPRAFDTALWRRVASSPVVRSGNGYVAHGWEFARADRPTLRAVAASGTLRAWGRGLISVPELPRAVPDGATLQLTMWAGEPRELLEEGRRIAAADGREGVGVYVPHVPDLLRTAARAGFEVVEWGDEAILCEVQVPPARSHPQRPAGGTR